MNTEASRSILDCKSIPFKRFLEGLLVYGKGDWRGISRNLVVTRTPTQVASHAQKYFLRQEAQEKKRRSIHDITISDVTMVMHEQPTPPAIAFYGSQGIGPPGGQGGGEAQTPLTPAPVSFYAGDGASSPPTLQPTYFYVEGQGGALSPPSLLPNNFYGEQGGALMEDEFVENFIYYPY
ncbi:hypothetical protein L1987_34907 [Smallanthus sonchifolius]|uniref:Uncharacterized protein n=1 Tax=Smallanthus sonchifolius TaxID=185202 RepID=A0ACB9HWB9_9ASTR|nr:hypothetical protein L1987_34907 [Smallanthus sonchifolius]